MKTGVVLAAMFLAGQCWAQKNFVPGYIITISGDTTKGEVNYQEWDQNPRNIQFRISTDRNPQAFLPHEISGFGTTGRHYRSAITQVDKSPYKSEQVVKGVSRQGVVTDTVYLELLVKGQLNLYALKDENGKIHFFDSEGSKKPQELILKRVFTTKGGSTYVAEIELFKNTLKESMKDCGKVVASIDRVTYERRSLTGLYTSYNTCKGALASFSQQTDKAQFLLNFSAGASVTTLDFKGDNSANLVRAGFETSINPTVALGVNMILPRNRQRWSAVAEIQFRTYQTEPTESVAPNQYKFDFSYLKINAAYRYTYPQGNTKPFAQVGLAYGQAIKSETTLSVFRKDEQGLFGGIGVKHKKLSFEARYESTNAMSAFLTISSSANTIYALLTYQMN